MKRRKCNLKGQVFSSEVVMAYFIFSLTLVIVLFLWNISFRQIKNSEKFYLLEETAFNLGEKLVKTSGFPNNWTKENVISVGLTSSPNEPRVLDESKILEFVYMMNSSYYYEETRGSILGIGKYEFYFNLTDINGTTIKIQNVSCHTGKIPENTNEMITVTRTALLNGEIVRLILTVWYGK